MIIAGLTGGIGHGKTTLAHMLASSSPSAHHFETWELVAEVANSLRFDGLPHPNPNDIEAVNHWLLPLVDAIAQCVHVPVTFSEIKLTPKRLQAHPENFAKLFEYLNVIKLQPEIAKQELSETNKAVYRPLLQWLGGYLVVACSSGVWYDEIMRRAMRLQSTDCELVTVGGVRYPADAERLRNAGGIIIQIIRPQATLQDSQDLTERYRDQIIPDTIVYNDAAIDDLQRVSAILYTDLRLRELQPKYRASTTK